MDIGLVIGVAGVAIGIAAGYGFYQLTTRQVERLAQPLFLAFGEAWAGQISDDEPIYETDDYSLMATCEPNVIRKKKSTDLRLEVRNARFSWTFRCIVISPSRKVWESGERPVGSYDETSFKYSAEEAGIYRVEWHELLYERFPSGETRNTWYPADKSFFVVLP